MSKETNSNTHFLSDLLDLDMVPENEREQYLADVSELVMQSIMSKAWTVLNNTQRTELENLLKESGKDPENEEKSNEVYAYLVKHVPQARDIAAKQIEKLQQTYRETRDEILENS